MLLKDEVQMLRRVPLLAGIDQTKLKLLAFTSDRVSFGNGEVLFNQGDPGDAAYVILTGKADVLVNTPDGKGQIRVAEVAQNSLVGEIAILCDVARTATVKAATPIEALRIRKDHFVKMLTDYPEMTIEVMRVLADRLSQTGRKSTRLNSSHPV